MGLVNSISLLSNRRLNVILPSVTSFLERVELDGGELESINCLNRAIKRLPQADFGRVAWDAYSIRVLADSGTLEARACTINDINDLKQ